MPRRLMMAVAGVLILLGAVSCARSAAPSASSSHVIAVGAGTGTLRVLSHNICGGSSCGNLGSVAALRPLESRMAAYAPQIVMLQEVCWSQYQSLKSTYAGTYAWEMSTMLDDYSGCAPAGTDCSVNNDSSTTNDNPACYTGIVLGTKGTLSNRNEIDLGGDRYQIADDDNGVRTRVKPRTFHALCYDVTLTAPTTSRVLTACSTHLRAFQDDDLINRRARAAEAYTLTSDLDYDIYGRGRTAIVGGDLNSGLQDQAMSAFYTPKLNNSNVSVPAGQTNGGSFVEADEDDNNYCSGTYCRAAQPTCCRFPYDPNTNPGSVKYDYIFVGDRTTGPGNGTHQSDVTDISGGVYPTTTSDHGIYQGLFTFTS
jgi:endonuclease/exonuclease/phosphatase family protein